jgi:hypothetical protein
MAKDYHAEYPIIKETWGLIQELKEEVLPALRKESKAYYAQLPLYLAMQKAEELLSEHRN